MTNACLALNNELKKLKPKIEDENRFYLQLMRTLHTLQPIENTQQHALYLDMLKKISIFLNESEKDPALVSNADAQEQLEGYAQYAEVLEELIEHYERKKFPAQGAEPREILEFLMEQHGLVQKDIAQDLGGQPNVSDILSGKRNLNLHQIQRLATRFHVSPATFLQA